MVAKTLFNEEKRIDEYVKRFYPKKYINREPILDGITDIDSYIKSVPKICWVLKEPYDEKKGQGGGFDLRKMLKKDLKKKNHNFGNTWTPIGYISYSLLNNFIQYKELKKLDKNIVMKSLMNISYINIGKMPAKFQTISPYKNVKQEYNIWAPILLWQILKYDPDIIIFGNTLSHFNNDLKLLDIDYKKIKGVNHNYIEKYGKLILDVYHPAVRESTISEKDYFNSIINTVKKYIEKTKNSI
jgi:hypothetical protein